jgi:tetratricopeptide (TPR) repeat protein
VRFRLLACIALVLASSSPLLAQIGQISGQVRYAGSNQPAFNAIVSCDSYTSGFIGQLYADRNGRFQFTRLQLGQYTIRVRFPGYTEEKQDVDLSTAITANLQFQLKADSSKPAVSPVTGTIAANLPPAAAKAEFDQASSLLGSGKKEDIPPAVRHLEKAVSLYPRFAEAELKLGTAYMDLQQWDKAEQALKKTIEIDPKAANGYFALGEVYRRQKRFDQAEKTLQDGLAIETRSAQAHLTLARVYWDRVAGVKDEAQWRPPLEKSYQEVKQALDLDPNLAAAHLLKGNLLFKVRRAEDALKEFDEYLRLDPNGEFAAPTRELAEKIRKALAQEKKP